MATIYQLFRTALSRFPKNAALTERCRGQWDAQDYSAFGDQINEFGTGLIALGLNPEDKVGFFINRGTKWLIGDLAILGAGAVDVPRGSDMALEELAYICRHAEIRIALGDFSPDLIDALKREAPELSCIISPNEGIRPESGFGVFTWDEVKEKGRTALLRGDQTFAARTEARRTGNLATIVYTSGTTGKPKGVMLTHSNITSNVSQLVEIIDINPGDIFLSILPPYHMFERVAEYVALSSGGHIVFSELNSIGKDILQQKPHYIAGVPRLWEMVYHAAMDRLKKEKSFSIIQKLINCERGDLRPTEAADNTGFSGLASASNTFNRYLRQTCRLPIRYLVNKLVFSKFRAKMGGRLKLAISGGGTLPLEIDQFLNSAGICLLNGYGLTETSPVLTLRRPGRNSTGTVGEPLPGTQIRVCGENCEILASGSTGIIWAKGPQVMKGYYKDSGATDAVLQDGWLNTGDTGLLQPGGSLIINGRAKDTIVLVSGENVEPEPIENRLALSSFISQAMVVGQDQKHIGALIVPDWKKVKDFCAGNSNGASSKQAGVPSEKSQLIADIKKIIRSEIDQFHNSRTKRPWEKITRFKIIQEDWTPANNLVTFTLKKKRAAISEKYAEEIRSLF